MNDFQFVRRSAHCPLCGGDKARSALCCWPCFNSRDMAHDSTETIIRATNDRLEAKVTVNDIQHFWSPPGPNERLLGMAKFQDVMVIATTDGVYVITDHGRPLPEWEVRRIVPDFLRSLKD